MRTRRSGQLAPHAVDEVLPRSPPTHALSAKTRAAKGHVEYEALGTGVTFWMPPLEKDTEITGPMAAKSSSLVDAGRRLVFIVRVFDPAGKES